MADVTIKSTKAQIYEAYQKLLKERKAKSEDRLNVSARQKDEKQRQVLKDTEDILTSDAISTVRDKIVGALDDLKSVREKEEENFEKIKEAVQIKSEELKQLFDIEKEASTLAALIDTQKDFQEAFEKEKAEKLENLKKELGELKEKIASEQEIFEKEKSRNEDDYAYDFEREKKLRLDELADDIAQQRKELSEEIEKFHKEKKVVEDLEKDIEELKAEKEKEIQKEVAKSTNALKSNMEHQRKIMELELNAKVERLESEKDNLTQEIGNLRTQIIQLTEKLDAAYKEMKDLSVQTVQSAGSEKLASTLTQLKDSFEKRGK